MRAGCRKSFHFASDACCTRPSLFSRLAAVMAADFASTPKSGPTVQACGDARWLNFGGFATPERNVIFDINDFDETLPAPWEWDLKRLVASVVIAGRHIGLSESDAARAAMATACSYREQIADYRMMRRLRFGRPLDVPGECSDRLRLFKTRWMSGFLVSELKRLTFHSESLTRSNGYGASSPNVTHNKCYATCAQFADATLSFLREKVPGIGRPLSFGHRQFPRHQPNEFRVMSMNGV